jgi:hypothetical protein
VVLALPILLADRERDRGQGRFFVGLAAGLALVALRLVDLPGVDASAAVALALAAAVGHGLAVVPPLLAAGLVVVAVGFSWPAAAPALPRWTVPEATLEWRVFAASAAPGRVRNLAGVKPGLAARLAENPELLAAFNVRWLDAPRRPPDLGKPQHFRRLDGERWEVVGPAPLVLWYGRVLRAAAPQALEILLGQEQQPGQRRRAIVQQALPGLEVPDRAVDPRPGQLTRFENNRVAFTIDAPAEGLVVLAERLAPGWTVSVDGRPARAVPANVFLRGVVVPAGVHAVEWTYSPPGFRLRFGLWILGVVLLVVIAAARRRGRPA